MKELNIIKATNLAFDFMKYFPLNLTQSTSYLERLWKQYNQHHLSYHSHTRWDMRTGYIRIAG